jgi:outer membrane protein assembly factor BamA
MKAMDRLVTLLRCAVIALAGLLVGAPGVPAQEQAAKVLVDDVIPQGNHQVPTQKIISLIKTRPGLEYKQETVDEDVRKLYETKLFANIQVLKQPMPDGKVKVFFLVDSGNHLRRGQASEAGRTGEHHRPAQGRAAEPHRQQDRPHVAAAAL